MNYQIVRTKRRSIGIYILEDGSVEVRAPRSVSKNDIDCFVQKKASWIEIHSALRQKQAMEKRAFTKKPGDTFLLFGEEVPIVAQTGNTEGFDGQHFYMPENVDFVVIRPMLVEIYREIAGAYLSDRTYFWAQKLRLQPKAVKINGAKTRWGSCSGKNSINFSWRLMMVNKSAIDYVIVHELCHIKEHNHSSKFWALVAAILPDYKIREKNLKELHEQLVREQWDES